MEPMHRPRVAVVCGGRSAEAEVSRSSGGQVAEALARRLDHVSVVEHEAGLAHRLEEVGAEVVFPVMHGPPGEDGTLQGFLDTLGLPYVGSGVLASACAMHKPVAKAVFSSHGLPVARDTVVEPGEGPGAAERVRAELSLPVVVKPVDQGSAIGVAFCHDAAELDEALADAPADAAGLLVEELVPGREVTVGVLEQERPEALPVVEITTPEGTWYDFEHRYTPGASEHLVPAPLSREGTERLQDIALRAHTALGCRDLSRSDLVLAEDGEPVLLEVNTMPGMTATSLYPDAAAVAGVSFEDLVLMLVQRALARAGAAD